MEARFAEPRQRGDLSVGGKVYLNSDVFSPVNAAKEIKEDTEKYFSIIDLNKTYTVESHIKVDKSKNIYYWEFTLNKRK